MVKNFPTKKTPGSGDFTNDFNDCKEFYINASRKIEKGTPKSFYEASIIKQDKHIR